MVFHWVDQMSVNVKQIDAQHKYFVTLLNECYDYVVDKKVKEVVTVSLEKILAYAKVHFATEERYFDEFNYELAEEHKREHKRILDNINKIMKEREGSDDIYGLANDLVELLESWLVEHLYKMDKLYTKCFNDHGLY